MSNDDERELKLEIERNGGEGQAQLKRIKKLEERVDQLGLMVNNLFLKYDQQMKEIADPLS